MMTVVVQVGVSPVSTSADGSGVTVPPGKSAARKTTISHSPLVSGSPPLNENVPLMLVVPVLPPMDDVVFVGVGVGIAVPDTGGRALLDRGGVGVVTPLAFAGTAETLGCALLVAGNDLVGLARATAVVAGVFSRP